QIIFDECEFENCNLSNVETKNTSFRHCRSIGCKMLGFKFNEGNAFLLSFTFSVCNLQFSSFHNLTIAKTYVMDCKLEDVDFSDGQLNEAVFDLCNLRGALFDGTNLMKANFSTATNYSIDPENNKIQGAHFSKDGLSGLLDKYKLKIK